jgi:hypothetical protein
MKNVQPPIAARQTPKSRPLTGSTADEHIDLIFILKGIIQG